MKNKVSYARFHQPVYLPLVGDIGPTLPSQNKTLEGLEMSYSLEGLEFSFTVKGVSHFALIPLTNIVILKLDK